MLHAFRGKKLIVVERRPPVTAACHAQLTAVGAIVAGQIRLLTEKIDGLMLKLREATKANKDMRRLCTVPGVGPVTAGAILAFAPESSRI